MRVEHPAIFFVVGRDIFGFYFLVFARGASVVARLSSTLFQIILC